MHDVAGITSAILSFVGFLPYFYQTIWGRVRPSRATWFSWAGVATMLFLTYGASGADETLYTAGVDALVPILMALVAIKYGTGGWSPTDRVCLAIAGSSVVLWAFAGPVAALVLNLIADAAGAFPTVLHAARYPEEESSPAWTTFTVANIVNMFAIDTLAFEIVIFPVYFLVMTGTISTLLYWPRGHRKEVC